MDTLSIALMKKVAKSCKMTKMCFVKNKKRFCTGFPQIFYFYIDIDFFLCYNEPWYLGVAQLVACYLGVVEAVGSSPITQTKRF